MPRGVPFRLPFRRGIPSVPLEPRRGTRHFGAYGGDTDRRRLQVRCRRFLARSPLYGLPDLPGEDRRGRERSGGREARHPSCGRPSRGGVDRLRGGAGVCGVPREGDQQDAAGSGCRRGTLGGRGMGGGGGQPHRSTLGRQRGVRRPRWRPGRDKEERPVEAGFRLRLRFHFRLLLGSVHLRLGVQQQLVEERGDQPRQELLHGLAVQEQPPLCPGRHPGSLAVQ